MLYQNCAVLLLVGFLSACGSESNNQLEETGDLLPVDKSVEIQFAARAGSEDILCQKMENVLAGTSNAHPEFTDVRMYISEISLVNSEGETVLVTLDQDQKWQYQNVALLDFEDGTGSCANGNSDTNSTVKGTVPEGVYTGIKFTLGVPAELNHLGIDGDDAVSPLDTMGMNWSWQNGHKHLRMDVKGWNIHIGTTGCEVVDADTEVVDCASARNNRPVYQFDNFNAATETIVLDYLQLVAQSDIAVNQENTPIGCMSAGSDADCAGVFNNLGLALATGSCIDDNCSDLQRWITVE